MKLAAIRRKVARKAASLRKCLWTANMRHLRLSRLAKQTPEIANVKVSPGPEHYEKEEVTFLQLDILQQLSSGAGRARRSRRSLHNKKSLKSVIEEARQQLSASVEARREMSSSTASTGPTSLARRELSVSTGPRFGLVTYDEYVDYEDIVCHQHSNFDSDYVEMR